MKSWKILCVIALGSTMLFACSKTETEPVNEAQQAVQEYSSTPEITVLSVSTVCGSGECPGEGRGPCCTYPPTSAGMYINVQFNSSSYGYFNGDLYLTLRDANGNSVCVCDPFKNPGANSNLYDVTQYITQNGCYNFVAGSIKADCGDEPYAWNPTYGPQGLACFSCTGLE